MDLPNYFLADLPDDSTFTPKLITEACATLKENREKFLASRTTESLVAILAGLARDWLDDDFPFRRMVLEQGPAETGFSRPTIANGLDRFFQGINRNSLEALVAQDLGSPRRLDDLVADPIEMSQDRRAIARGYDLLAHVTGGVLPNPVLTSLMLGLLVRSAQFIKCARGTSFIPRLFAHSLYAIHPKLGACLEIAEWKGGNQELENALFAEACAVISTGTDETLGAIRSRLPANVRFFGYGHKLSLAFVTRESLARAYRSGAIAALADDIVAWNQLGCLSPHAVYVETGGAVGVSSFAEELAAELDRREREEPRGEIDAEDSAAIATRRMFYEVRASGQSGTKLWTSANSTAWTVVFEDHPEFQISCLNRFIYVKPIAEFDQLLTVIASLHGCVSTAGVSAPPERLHETARLLARAGVSRICPLGQMQRPPFTWRHDGRPALGDLITWTDVEF